MATDSFQKKLDALIDDLGLTVEEREYLYSRRRTDRKAKRVVNLLREAVECRSFQERRHLLELLVSAVSALRSQIQAEQALVPEGFKLVSEEILAALRALAVCAIQLYGEQASVAKSTLISRMGRLRLEVLNLDAVVAAEVGGVECGDEGGEAA